MTPVEQATLNLELAMAEEALAAAKADPKTDPAELRQVKADTRATRERIRTALDAAGLRAGIPVEPVAVAAKARKA